ncbi:MAG: hypothetical protein M0R80_04210 [Proteobacteria bacterium]|jgi:hypothetical protein|nr:hypothetical protein [Pseudomonadota bacterium]
MFEVLLNAATLAMGIISLAEATKNENEIDYIILAIGLLDVLVYVMLS